MLKAPRALPVTVMQAPLTAMESPRLIFASGSAVRIVSTAPWAERLIAATVPRSSMMPVNT